jgi:hypothetical protein
MKLFLCLVRCEQLTLGVCRAESGGFLLPLLNVNLRFYFRV